jgi:hypothetical protein
VAFSRVTKIGDGVSTQFSVNFALDYVDPTHVTARVGTEVDGLGDPVYRTITFITTNLLQISGDPAGVGVQVLFERTVPKDELIINYNNGDVLDEINLDTSQKQVIMAVQEVLDGRFTTLTQDLDMGGFTAVNLRDPEEDTDAATKDYVDTAVENVIGGIPADGSITTAKLADDGVTNAKLANMAQATFKGRAYAAGTGDPTDLTATQARAILNIDGTLDADKPISTPTISYLNSRYEQTVHTLTGQSDPANITAALIEAGLAANTDLQVVKYLGYDYAHDNVTIADRDIVIQGAGSGATLIDFSGADGGFTWSDNSTSLTNGKAFSAVGMTVRTDDTAFRAFDARWRPRPFFFDGQLATFEDINGITNDIKAAQAWTEIIYCENAQGFSASRIDGSNRRDNESGKAIRLKTCLGGARLHDCNLNYFDDLVYVEPTAFSLCGFTGITGTFEAGDVITTSGGATGMLMRDLSSSNFAIIPITGSFTVTHTVTGSLSGATGTIGSVDNTRWWAGEGLWVSKIEGVGVKRGVNVYNPNSVYQKFVGVFLEGIHANAKEAAVNLEYCTQVEGSTALLYTLANNAICYRLVGTDKAVVRGRVHNPGAFTGTVGIVVSAGTAGYGTNTADEIEYNIDFDNLATEESIDPSATNIRKLVKSDAQTGALADILRLKTLTSDPAPVAGGMYYNSSIGSIKGSNGVSWYTITWS